MLPRVVRFNDYRKNSNATIDSLPRPRMLRASLRGPSQPLTEPSPTHGEHPLVAKVQRLVSTSDRCAQLLDHLVSEMLDELEGDRS